MTRYVLQIVSALLVTGTSVAADYSFFSTMEAAGKASSSPIISIGYIMQLFFSLLVVFGLIYVSAKFVMPKLQTPTSTSNMKVLDRIMLEPQVTAYILKAGKSSYLIVASNKSASLISKLEEDLGQK